MATYSFCDANFKRNPFEIACLFHTFVTMWPVLLDMPRDDCKRQLRRLELDAYATVMTAFRAQGDLDSTHKQILTDLQSVLSISSERHRAEVRRAVNDERLYTIAEKMGCAADANEKWVAEGRRLVPLLPRLVPQTAFTAAATNAANLQAEKNLNMCLPADTPFLEANIGSSGLSAATPVNHGGGASHVGIASHEGVISHGGGASHSGIESHNARTSYASSVSGSLTSTGNVVVLPNGMSIHIKGGTDVDVDLPQPPGAKRRRRSSSTESLLVGRQLTPPSSARPTHLPPSNPTQSIAPLKVGLSKGQLVKGIPTQTQKVIIVSGSTTGTPPSMLPKMYMGGKGVVTATTSATSLISHVKAARPSGSGGTIAAGKTAAGTGGSTLMTTYTSSQLRPSKPVQYSRGTMVIPVCSPLQQSTPVSFHSVHGKVTPKPAIHIKQEGSMKIITQALPSASTSKILPKPATCSIVAMTTTPSAVTMTTQMANIGVTSVTSGKMLTVSASGHRLVTASTVKSASPNIVTVNPRKLQFATIKGPPGTTVLTANRLEGVSGGKSNVFVVQKAGKTTGTSTAIHVTTTVPSVISSAFEKELVSFIQKQDSHQKQLVITQQKVGIEKRPAPRQTVIETSRQLLVKQCPVESSTAGRSSLLAELIHAAGIVPETKTGASDNDTGSDDTTQADVVSSNATTLSKDDTWVEYDESLDTGHMTQSGNLSESLVKGQTLDPAALKAILELTTSQSRSSTLSSASRKTQLDLSQLTTQLSCSQSEVYIIEESGQLAPVSVASRDPVTTLAGDYNIDTNKVKMEQPVSGVASTGQLVQVTNQSTAEPEREKETVVEEMTEEMVGVGATAGGVATAQDVGSAEVGGVATEMIDSVDGACFEEEVVGELDQHTGLFYVRPVSSESVIDHAEPVGADILETGTDVVANEANTQLTGVDSQVTGADIQVTGADIQVTGADTQITGADTQLTGADTQLTGADTQLTGADTQLTGADTQHTGAKTQYTGADTRLTGANTQLTGADTLLTGANMQLTGADTQLSGADTRITRASLEHIEETHGRDVMDSASTESVSVGAVSSVTSHGQTSVVMERKDNMEHSAVGEEDLLQSALGHADIDQGDSVAATVSAVTECIPETQFVSILMSAAPHITTVAPSVVIAPITHPEQSAPSHDIQIVTSVTATMTSSVTMSPAERCVTTTRTVTSKQLSPVVTGPCNVTVTVEPAGLDTTYMKIEDFTSQRVDHADMVSYVEDSGPQIGDERERSNTRSDASDTTATSDNSDVIFRPMTLSDSNYQAYKRKRKMAPASDAWVKQAFGLLQRVCRFRGVNKEKGEMNAASWFTRPVSLKAVPDYCQVIKHPMDFGTIRKKLESSQYADWAALHADMMLVKQNCHQYNLPGTKVRYDCDQVFEFYLVEYNKVTGLQTTESCPSSKATRLDASPN